MDLRPNHQSDLSTGNPGRRPRSTQSQITAISALEKLRKLDGGLAAAYEAHVERRKTPRGSR